LRNDENTTSYCISVDTALEKLQLVLDRHWQCAGVAVGRNARNAKRVHLGVSICASRRAGLRSRLLHVLGVRPASYPRQQFGS
jgi:hypothetical protein